MILQIALSSSVMNSFIMHGKFVEYDAIKFALNLHMNNCKMSKIQQLRLCRQSGNSLEIFSLASDQKNLIWPFGILDRGLTIDK